MSNWDTAQEHELQVWERTAQRADHVLSELAEVSSLVDLIPSDSSGIQSALDVGVGPLGISVGSIVGAERTVGIDPLPRLVVQTGVPHVDEFIGRLQSETEYVQADATKILPFDDASFDLVICDNVVDHTQDPARVLRECRRLVDPDGVFVFGVNVFSALGIVKWRQVTRRLHPASENVICHPHSFVESGVRSLLSECGWHVEDDRQTTRQQQLVGNSYRYRVLARPTRV